MRLHYYKIREHMNRKIITYGLVCLRYTFGAFFVIFGVMAIYGLPMFIDTFNTINFGQWFRYFVGAWELVAGILLFVPSMRHFGAVLLFLVCGGAFLAQVSVLHQDWIHTIVLMALCALLIFQDRSRFNSYANWK